MNRIEIKPEDWADVFCRSQAVLLSLRSTLQRRRRSSMTVRKLA